MERPSTYLGFQRLSLLSARGPRPVFVLFGGLATLKLRGSSEGCSSIAIIWHRVYSILEPFSLISFLDRKAKERDEEIVVQHDLMLLHTHTHPHPLGGMRVAP